MLAVFGSKKALLLIVALILLIGGGAAIFVGSQLQKASDKANAVVEYADQDIALKGVVSEGDINLTTTQSLSINGQLNANNSIVLKPSSRPKDATAGQLYFDDSDDQLMYYDGKVFTPVASESDVSKLQSQLQGLATQSQTSALSAQVQALQSQVNSNQLPSGIALLGGANKFSAQNSFNAGLSASSLNVSGATSLGPSTISSLVLSSALPVSSGGTGRSSLALNGVLVGQGTGAISSVTAGSTGQGLISTAGAPTFQACPGGSGGVDSLNGITGAVTLSNASAAGSTVTINNASTAAKGIAQFNASNFNVSSGNVNTIQNISVGSTPTFAGLNLNGTLNISSNSITTNTSTISSSELDVLDGGITESEVSGVITDVTAGNGLTGGAASGNATLNVGAGSCITVAPGTVGVTNNCVDATTLDGNDSSYYLNATNINTGTLSDARLSANVAKYSDVVSNFTGTLQQNGNQVCDTSGNCGYSGDGSGAGVASLNSLSGDLNIQGTGGQIAVASNGTDTLTLSLNASVSLLGQTIEGSEISDGTINEADLNITNSESNGYVLVSNGDGTFSWVDPAGVGLSYSAGNQLSLAGTTFNVVEGAGSGLDADLLDGQDSSYYTNASNINSGTLTDARLSANVAKYNDASANFTGTLRQNGNQVCDTSGNCGYTGAGTGNGVASLNSLDGDLTIQGAAGKVTVADNATNTITIDLDASVSLLGQTIEGSEITNGTIATVDLANDSVTGAKIADGTITGTDIADDTIALGTKTTGNYVANTNAGTGIAITGAGGEGSTPTISLDYTSTLGSNTLGVNQSSFAATGILFEGSTADTFETLFTVANPTADNTITLPDASGTVCLTSGNCAGVGGGVTTAGGTTNQLAKFTAGQAIGDSSISDDGSTVSTTGNLVVQGGNVTAGTVSQLGSFILHDGNGQTTTLRAGNSGSNLTFTLPTNTGSQYQCLKYDTGGQLIWDDCDGGSGGGSGVTSLNGMSGGLSIQGNSQIGVSPSSPNINLSINADSIGDSQLAFNTGQHLTVSSTPTFAGLTLNGNVNIGANSIVTSGATISAGELNVLDGGIDESEVAGVITDVTAGTGLTGGAGSGNATVNVASGNGAIVVGADDISLTLQAASNGLSSTTSSGSGLEILGGGLSLLQGCNDGEVLKWNETTDEWGCAVDAGGSGVGDDIQINGSNTTNANFIDTVASGSSTGVAWGLNTAPSPDQISIAISNASATQAGAVTTGAQAFAGDKTFNNALTVEGLVTANGGITLQNGDVLTVNGDPFTDLTGTGLLISGGSLQTSLGTSIDSSEIIDGAIATADIGDGQVTSLKIADGTITGTDIANDTIALGTKTTGNYVAGTNAGTGIAITGSGGEGSTPTISLDYSSDLSSNSLGVNQSSFASTGVLFEGATANGFETLLTAADPTADNTITLPNSSGTVCLTSGNCAGVGGGVTTAGGTTNRLAKFTGAQTVGDSSISDDGSTVTTTGNLVVQGGNVTAGTGSQLGSFILHDGNGQTTTLRAGDSASNLSFILPTSTGSQYQCLKYDSAGQLIWDDCEGGSGGDSGVTSVNGLTGGVSIQGNSQIGVSPSSPNINLSINADSIGDSQLAFNTGQHLTVSSTPTFAGLTLNGNVNIGANSIVTSGATISAGELNVLDAGIDETEVTGVITDVTAGAGLIGGGSSGNATVNVAAGNAAIQVNADNIALALQPSTDNLSSTTSSGSGLEVTAGGLSLLQGCSDTQILKWNEATDVWACGADNGGGALTLQDIYNQSGTPAQILLTNAKDFVVTSQDTATDPNILFNLACSSCSANGGRFAIQDAGVDIFRVNPNGDIIIGTASNNITFEAANNYQSILNGSAKRTKTITLAPEYSGVVLDATADASCSSANAGTMTSGYTTSGVSSLPENYYQWTSTGTAQCYNVIVQVKIPDDFNNWTGSQTVDTWSSSTGSATARVDIRDTAGAQDGTSYGNVVTPTVSSTWQARPITFSGTYDNTSAGKFVTLRVRTTSSSGETIRLGNIKLNYQTRY